MPWFYFLVGRVGYAKEIEARPNVAAWWAKASGDPAWKKIVGEQELNGH